MLAYAQAIVHLVVSSIYHIPYVDDSTDRICNGRSS